MERNFFMKRIAIMTAMLAGSLVGSVPVSVGQAASKDAKKDAAPAQAAPSAPNGKRLRHAKTHPAFDAYQAAMASTTPEATEKAADDFAAKFPDSEIKILIFKQAMRS